WPERVHIFADDHVESKELHLDDGLVTVSGISYPSRDVTQNLALEFPRPARPGFHVAVLHANVGGSAEHPNYSPCSIEDLVQSGYDYWALGHIHGRQTLRVAKPVIAYPGNTQGRSFKPSEQGPKGASLVTVDDGVATTQFLDLGPIHFVELEVPATDLTDIGDLNEALMAAARSAQVPNRAVVLRGRVTGPTHLYDDLTRHDASDELLKILEDQTRHDAGVWWTNLHIDVRPERDFDAMARHDDLPGEVVRQGRAITGDMDELRFRLRDQTALGPWADQINDDELRAIADRATAIAASMVDKIRGE
ncbi:MAG: metallophosphoesterase family protein, partial [Bradymonadaceae bacterium]